MLQVFPASACQLILASFKPWTRLRASVSDFPGSSSMAARSSGNCDPEGLFGIAW